MDYLGRMAKSLTKQHCFVIPMALTDCFSKDGDDVFEKLAVLLKMGMLLGLGNVMRLTGTWKSRGGR